MSKEKIESGKNDLKDIQITILEKIFTAFDKIPTSMLSEFPAYDPEVYLRLRSLYQRIRAKIRQSDKKLQVISSQEVDDDQYIKDKQALLNLNNSFNNDFNEDTYDQCEDVKPTLSPQPVADKKAKNLTNNVASIKSANNSAYKNEENLNDSLESHDNLLKERISQNDKTPQSSPMQAQKKSKFQLKVPVKVTIDPKASKQLEEIIEKNNLSKQNSSCDLNDSFSPKLTSQSPVAIRTNNIQSGFEFKNSTQGNNFQSPVNAWKKTVPINVQSNGYNSVYNEQNLRDKKNNVPEFQMENQISSFSAFGT